MPSTCVFEFDRREPIYYSGETINGRAILTTTSRKSVNGKNLTMNYGFLSQGLNDNPILLKTRKTQNWFLQIYDLCTRIFH